MCGGGSSKTPPKDTTAQPPVVTIPEKLPKGDRKGVSRFAGGSFVSGADAFAFSGRASPFRISLFQERA